MPLASHVTRRPSGTYYYRQRIPNSITSFYEGKREVCFSLRTKEPAEAKQLSYAYSLKYAQEFDRYNKQIQLNSLKQSDCASAHTGKITNILKEWDGRYEGEMEQIKVSRPEPVKVVSYLRNKVKEPDFAAIWDMYAAEGKLSEATRTDNETHIRRFLEIAGNKPISQYSKQDIRYYKDILLKVPAHMNAAQKQAGILKTIKKLESTNPDYRKLAPHNVKNRCLSVIRVVFSYAVSNGLIDTNPTDDITVICKRKTAPARLPFTNDDLNTILTSELFSGRMNTLSPDRQKDHQWIILLAIFTGARLEEIGRLSVDDIGVEDDVQYIYIHADESKGRTVKNAASVRKVPIHSALISLGFLRFVAEARKHKHTALFPTLFKTKIVRGKCTHNFSQWFGRYCDKIGIHQKEKTFHSFRHTFKRVLRNAGVDKTLIDALQGHIERDVSSQYGRDELGMGFALPALKKAIEKDFLSNNVADIFGATQAQSISNGKTYKSNEMVL